jgi:Skp family chaperone for outer membrane proteins
MSRNGLVIAGVALLLAVGALVLQFALPSGGGSSEIRALQADIEALQRQGTGGSTRVAYINVEDAFKVFLNSVSDLRQRALDKQAEIVALQQDYSESTISSEDFQQQGNELQTELLDAQVAISLGTIDKMIASEDFANIRSELERLRETAEAIARETKNLVSTARVGIVDATTFQNRYNSVKSAFSQLDQLITDAAASKIVEAGTKIANQYGYDLVLVKKDVIIYSNPATVIDITELVKTEIADYL